MPVKSGIERLRLLEDAIAKPDRRRLASMRSSKLIARNILKNRWPELKEGFAVTEAITRRMFNHYKTQKDLKEEIGLSVAPSASGVFHQAVGMYLKAYLETIGHYPIFLDKRYNYGRKYLRPDIAIERDGKPAVAIEVKTDLGWKRDYIESGDWTRRQKHCESAGFKLVYLLILANTNWSGFEVGMEEQGIRVMLSVSPNDPKFEWYQDTMYPWALKGLFRVEYPEMLHPIETLFEEVSGFLEK